MSATTTKKEKKSAIILFQLKPTFHEKTQDLKHIFAILSPLRLKSEEKKNITLHLVLAKALFGKVCLDCPVCVTEQVRFAV